MAVLCLAASFFAWKDLRVNDSCFLLPFSSVYLLHKYTLLMDGYTNI